MQDNIIYAQDKNKNEVRDKEIKNQIKRANIFNQLKGYGMENKEIVTHEPEEIIVPDQIVDQVLQLAEMRLINIKRLKERALSLTNEKDWCNLGGNPYLRAAGAEKVARAFGVQLKDVESKKINGIDALGDYYIWVYNGTAFITVKDFREEFAVQGICSSRDKFFSIDDGIQLPTSEVDEPNIMKKAYNNLVMQAITRFLGFRNMTWEEVKHGISDKSKATSVNYKSKKADTDPAEQDQKNEIIASMARILNEQVGKDDKKVRDVLIEVTTFGNLPKAEKIDDLKGFTIGRVKATYGKLKDKFQIKSEAKKEEPQEEEEPVSGDANAKPPVGKTAELPLGQKGGKR